MDKKNKFPGLKAILVFGIITIAGFLLDIWSKYAVFNWLSEKPGQRHVFVEGWFQFVTAYNPGAAFGIAEHKTAFLIGVSFAALVAILVIFIFSGKEPGLFHIALGLFTAGLCGNLYDRIFHDGLVRDFIDIVYWPGRHWPAFNVADSMLCIAVALLILQSIFTGSSDQKRDQQQRSESR